MPERHTRHTKAARWLSRTCDRGTVHRYIERYPELQEHRKAIIATMNDFAESTVKQAVWAREMGPTFKWLEKKHPEWTNKQILEHAGTLNLTAGLMTKAEIAPLSDDELQRLIAVRKNAIGISIANKRHNPCGANGPPVRA
jgi:hypothetical protein